VARPSRKFRLTALAAALAAWALVAVGGVVRITESGLGCPDWPLCEGRVVPKGSTEAAIEFSHRATAALVTTLVVLVAVWAWWRYRSRLDILVPAGIAAALDPGQALLGAIVVWLELPGWIVGFHFVVGMLFLAATVLTAVAAWPRGERAWSRGFVRLSWTAAAPGLLLVGAGAAVVSAHADEACGREWPACNGAFVAGGSDAAIQVVHRTLAYAVAGLTLALVVLAWRGRGPRRLGSLPFVAVLAQMGFGISLVLAGEESGAHDVLAGLHVAGAGVVWALLVSLSALSRLPLPAPAPEGRPGTRAQLLPKGAP
jgi:heme A synthase